MGVITDKASRKKKKAWREATINTNHTILEGKKNSKRCKEANKDTEREKSGKIGKESKPASAIIAVKACITYKNSLLG